MRKVGRFLAVLSLVMVVIARRRARWGSLDPTLLRYLTKSMAQALTPVWTTVGAVAALIGLFAGDGAATIGGALGTVIVADTIRRVLAPHNGFELAFGPAWEAQIPATAIRSMKVAKRLRVSAARFDRGSLEHWQPEVESGSLVELRLDRDLPSRTLHDLLHDGKAEARAHSRD